jgi:hypothetical protein
LKLERQNAARERKPIHLPPMQLREAFSYSFPFPVCCFARDESSCRELPRRSECVASLYNVIGCGPFRGSQKMAKTEAIPTKGIADRVAFLLLGNPKSKVGFAAASSATERQRLPTFAGLQRRGQNLPLAHL